MNDFEKIQLGWVNGYQEALTDLDQTIRQQLANPRARFADHPGLYTALHLIGQLTNTIADTQPIEAVK